MQVQRAKITILLILALFFQPSCGLIPKKVELGQDKIVAVPEVKSKESERLKQGAQRASETADETLFAALRENSTTNVIDPATATAILTEAVSESIGPPLSKALSSSAELAASVKADIARLERRLDEFRADNNKNIGKKIEGTGWLSVPYVVWLFGFVLLFFLGLAVAAVFWTVLKVYAASNPPIAFGLKTVSMGAKAASKLASEVIQGGENFQAALKDKFTPEIQQQIGELFVSSHQKAQSTENQGVVKSLTS